jgi:hypothetical protein
MKRAGVVLALVAVIVFALVSTATAAWQAGSAVNSKGSAKTMTVPQGATPTAVVAGDAVTVTWTATTSPPATGYTVKVYDASSHIARPIGAGCSGIVTASPCTETGVPGGTWEYSATPLVDAWVGGESARSGPVTVDAAPQPTALALVNGGGGTAGVIDPERDEVKITYSEPLAVDTICAGWTDNTANQSLSANGDVEVTVTDNAGANTLTVHHGQHRHLLRQHDTELQRQLERRHPHAHHSPGRAHDGHAQRKPRHGRDRDLHARGLAPGRRGPRHGRRRLQLGDSPALLDHLSLFFWRQNSVLWRRFLPPKASRRTSFTKDERHEGRRRTRKLPVLDSGTKPSATASFHTS